MNLVSAIEVSQQNVMASLMAGMTGMISSAGKTIRFRDALDKYIITHSRVYNKSWRCDELHARALVSFFGDIRLQDLNSMGVSLFIASDLEAGRTKATVNRRLSLLKAVVRKLHSWGYETPTLEIKLLKENHKTLFFTQDEIIAMFNTDIVNGPRGAHLWLFMKIALLTGMRKTEILTLKWKQIDIPNRVITLPDNKSGEEQSVIISDALADILSSTGRDTEYVIQYRGAKCKDVKKGFYTVFKQAGITREGICIHTFRHTFASNLSMGGTDLKTIQEFLRHSSITTTMRYAHVSTEHKIQEINKANAIMEGT